jgi:hypothetical protein
MKRKHDEVDLAFDDSIQPEKKQKEEIKTVINIDKLCEIFECAICKELLIDPHIVHCSHTFCHKCIVEWFSKKKECPTCRQMILKSESPNKSVDSLIQSILPLLSSEDRDIYEERKKENSDFFEGQFQKFLTVINKSTQNGTRFLKIKDVWNERARKVFRTGLERYHGRELVAYCELTGLNIEFINNATPMELIIAAANMDCQVPQSNQTGVDFEKLRRVLLDVILN